MKTCLECKFFRYDELFDEEAGEEFDYGYCEIGHETEGYATRACEDFKIWCDKEEKSNNEQENKQ